MNIKNIGKQFQHEVNISNSVSLWKFHHQTRQNCRPIDKSKRQHQKGNGKPDLHCSICNKDGHIADKCRIQTCTYCKMPEHSEKICHTRITDELKAENNKMAAENNKLKKQFEGVHPTNKQKVYFTIEYEDWRHSDVNLDSTESASAYSTNVRPPWSTSLR